MPAEQKRFWRVWNFGPTRSFPFKGQLIFISKASFIETTNAYLVRELKHYPFLKIEVVRT